jgi:hypothetical protein
MADFAWYITKQNCSLWLGSIDIGLLEYLALETENSILHMKNKIIAHISFELYISAVDTNNMIIQFTWHKMRFSFCTNQWYNSYQTSTSRFVGPLISHCGQPLNLYKGSWAFFLSLSQLSQIHTLHLHSCTCKCPIVSTWAFESKEHELDPRLDVGHLPKIV